MRREGRRWEGREEGSEQGKEEETKIGRISNDLEGKRLERRKRGMREAVRVYRLIVLLLLWPAQRKKDESYYERKGGWKRVLEVK